MTDVTQERDQAGGELRRPMSKCCGADGAARTGAPKLTGEGGLLAG